jgi:hypothetical protein
MKNSKHYSIARLLRQTAHQTFVFEILWVRKQPWGAVARPPGSQRAGVCADNPPSTRGILIIYESTYHIQAIVQTGAIFTLVEFRVRTSGSEGLHHRLGSLSTPVERPTSSPS